MSSIRRYGPSNLGGTGQGTQSHGGARPVLPESDEEVRVRAPATIPIDQLGEAVRFPETPSDVLQKVATTRTERSPSAAAVQQVAVTIYYDAGPHLSLQNVRLQLLEEEDSTTAQIYPMRAFSDGVFGHQLKLDPKARRQYRWRVLADVDGGDVRGNRQELRDERVTFGTDQRVKVQSAGTTVRYNAASYQRFGVVLDNTGRLHLRVLAPHAGKVVFKYWDEDGTMHPIRLQRDTTRASSADAPGKGRAPELQQDAPTWSQQLPRDLSAALVNRPYLFEIDDEEVTDPYARALAPNSAAYKQGTAQVAGPGHTFMHDATPRPKDARDWLTYRADLTQLAQEDGAPLEQLRNQLVALQELGLTTLELSGLTPQNAAGNRVQRNLAIDPSMGSVADLEALVDEAHGLGLNVVLRTEYDATAADRPADAEFIRNHAMYQLDTFHADGLRVAVSSGDGDAAQLGEITRQLACLRSYVAADDAQAPNYAVQEALRTGNLAGLQQALGVRNDKSPSRGVGQPVRRQPFPTMTPGQARLAAALGLLAPGEAGLSDAMDLGGFTWSPMRFGQAQRQWSARTPAPLDDLSFNESYRKKFETLMAMSVQARQNDPFFKSLSPATQLVLALLAALHPDLRRRAMDELTLRHMDRFAYDMLRLRKRWGAILAGPTESVCLHRDTGVSVTQHGKKLLVLTNTGETPHDSYSIPLPPGRWRRVIHSQEQRYGGLEPNSDSTPITGGVTRPMRLPAQSVQIFEAVDA